MAESTTVARRQDRRRWWHVGFVFAAGLSAAGCLPANQRPASQRTHQERPAPVDPLLSIAPKIAPQTHFAAARLLEQRGHYQEAIEQYRKAVAGNPKFVEAYNRLGVLLDQIGERSEARRAFEQALRLAPTRAAVHNDYGVHLLRCGEWKGAERSFRRALQCDPDYPRAWVNLGVALAQQGRDAEARRAFEKVLGREDALYNVALLQRHRGDYLAAATSLREAIAMYPAFEAAHEQLRTLLAAAEEELVRRRNADTLPAGQSEEQRRLAEADGLVRQIASLTRRLELEGTEPAGAAAGPEAPPDSHAEAPAAGAAAVGAAVREAQPEAGAAQAPGGRASAPPEDAAAAQPARVSEPRVAEAAASPAPSEGKPMGEAETTERAAVAQAAPQRAAPPSDTDLVPDDVPVGSEPPAGAFDPKSAFNGVVIFEPAGRSERAANHAHEPTALTVRRLIDHLPSAGRPPVIRSREAPAAGPDAAVSQARETDRSAGGVGSLLRGRIATLLREWPRYAAAVVHTAARTTAHTGRRLAAGYVRQWRAAARTCLPSLPHRAQLASARPAQRAVQRYAEPALRRSWRRAWRVLEAAAERYVRTAWRSAVAAMGLRDAAEPPHRVFPEWPEAMLDVAAVSPVGH